MRKALAWASIKDDTVVKGTLTTSQVKDVEDRAKSTKDAADAAVRLCFGVQV